MSDTESYLIVIKFISYLHKVFFFFLLKILKLLSLFIPAFLTDLSDGLYCHTILLVLQPLSVVVLGLYLFL